MIHVTQTTKAGEEDQDDYWQQTEYQSRPDPPWFETVKQAILDSQSGRRRAGDALAPTPSGKRPAGKRERVEAMRWPPLVEGESLVLGNAKSRFSVTLDGREQSPGRPLVAAKLGRGLHNLEVTEKDSKLGTLRLQIPLSVIAPVEIGVAPVTPIAMTEKRNGGIVELLLRNRSRSDHLVGLTVDATPPGWIGSPLGKPFAVLKAGKSRRVKVQVERMAIYDETDDLHQFTVRVTLPGAAVADIATAFDVTVEEAAARTGVKTVRK